MKVRWIVQRNLLAEDDLKRIREACDALDIPVVDVEVVPFSKELPDFPMDDEYENVYFGSTTFMYNLYRQVKPFGLFFNENFTVSNYIDKWGDHMLNSEAEIMTVEEILDTDRDGYYFVRPNGDGKEFDGEVYHWNKVKRLLTSNLEYSDNVKLDSEIVVNEPYNVRKEWRNYVVEGRVVTSSRYRENFRLSKSRKDVPRDMIEFVEDRAKEYQPHDVFAMDVALVKDDEELKYYIVECGCMNSVGFYDCDIYEYVKNISAYTRARSSVGQSS